jgi:phosphoribulokinase
MDGAETRVPFPFRPLADDAGGCSGAAIDMSRCGDRRVGVVPTVNLGWIRKLHRDENMRGHSQEAVVDTIPRLTHLWRRAG